MKNAAQRTLTESAAFQRLDRQRLVRSGATFPHRIQALTSFFCETRALHHALVTTTGPAARAPTNRVLLRETLWIAQFIVRASLRGISGINLQTSTGRPNQP